MGRALDFAAERERMMSHLVRAGYLKNPRVWDAFRAVPRERFVQPGDSEDAYVDVPLPIGAGQTISAPSMIAIMLDEASLEPGERVLEIGTGSGYHAALLAHLVGARNVITIERNPELASWGRSNLAGAGYGEVRVIVSDGSLGYPEGAPYDCIRATAGAPRIPVAWPPQLSPRGRIVAPVGSSRHGQVLVVATRRPDGTLQTRVGTSSAVVPLLGAAALPAL